MIKLVCMVTAAVTVFISLSATPAGAYPDAGSGSRCSDGDSGRACAHLETDAGSGHIRARSAATAANLKFINISLARLDMLTTERATGQQTMRTVLINREQKTSTDFDTKSTIAGPAQEQCDTATATFQWRAVMQYETILGGFTLDSGWQPGFC
jgi:hypothetical protein